MKTRTSLESKKVNIVKKNNNYKRKYQKKVKIKQTSNHVSYCDTHNIGKRKSNSSVVTYSLNSHLFFDVYAKFDKNSIARSNGMGKNSYKSPCGLLGKKTINVDNLQSPNSDDISTEAMSNYECPSNKSSPKRLNILCEAEPVNKDESLIPSPQMARILPFQSSYQSRVPRSVLSPENYNSNDNEIPQTNTETFHRILENKTVFKKHLSTVTKLTKSVPNLNLKPKTPNRLNNELKCLENLNCNRKEECNGSTVTSNNNHESKSANDSCPPIRQKRMASLNAAAIINCVQSLFNNRRKRPKSKNEMEIISEDITLQLNTDTDIKERESLTNVGPCEVVKTESKTKRRVGRPKKESAVKVPEKENGFETIMKKENISTTESDSVIDNSRKESNLSVSGRRTKREVVDGVVPYLDNNGGRSSKKVRKELDEASSVTLWQWEGQGQDRELELECGAVTRRCYAGIRHCQDDVVISVSDCVLLRTGDQGGEPYLARITAFYDDDDNGGSAVKKMMAILWYYRPEHTDQGRLSWHTEADVYASRHADTNSVDCIDDVAFVLPVEMYGRYMASVTRDESTTRHSLFVRMADGAWQFGDDGDDDGSCEQSSRLGTSEPPIDTFASGLYYSRNFLASFPPAMSASNVFVCRGFYDIKQHRVTRIFSASLSSPHPPVLAPAQSSPPPLLDTTTTTSTSSSYSRLHHSPLTAISATSIHRHPSPPPSSSTDIIVLSPLGAPPLTLSLAASSS